MNCSRAKTLLIPFLETELSGKQKEEVEAHLKICRDCHKEKELLSQSWQLLDSYVTPKLKDNFTSSLMRKIDSEQTSTVEIAHRLPEFTFRRLAPVLAILLITISILFWKKGSDGERSALITPRVYQETVYTVADEEIIKNLDLYENAELLDNLDMLTELDVIEKLDDPTLLQ